MLDENNINKETSIINESIENTMNRKSYESRTVNVPVHNIYINKDIYIQKNHSFIHFVNTKNYYSFTTK